MGMRNMTEEELDRYNQSIDSMSEEVYALTESEYMEMKRTIVNLEKKLVRANNVNKRTSDPVRDLRSKLKMIRDVVGNGN